MNLRNKRQLLKVKITDGKSGIAILNFWNQIRYFEKLLKSDTLLAISGKPNLDKYGFVEFTHPEIDIIEEEDRISYAKGAILPKYRITEKMRYSGISIRSIRTLMQIIINKEINEVAEVLPEHIIRNLNLPPIKECIINLHFPDDFEKLERARKRIKFDEIFYYLLSLHRSKYIREKKEVAPIITNKSELARKLYDELPFDLTKDQKKVLREIDEDFRLGKPMNRLLQGDVGSGKTIVAVLSSLMIIDAGYQVAFLAPTEILAEQHYQSVKEFTEKLDIKIALLTGSKKGKIKRQLKEEIESGEIKIIFGTHALIQKDVKYNNLAYLVIDEQHRFGVQQRADLNKLAQNSFNIENKEMMPHVLVMSATPIPRTLTMTFYGDLSVSLIKTKPANRKEIKTKIAYNNTRESVYEFVRSRIQSGEQAYFIYPLVEQSEKLELQAAVEQYEYLKQEVFPDLSCGLLHGKMKWSEKEEIMQAFKDKKYDILISTTVIEVGINVANATVMLIEHSERFGLSQLHQLRGRVGRSHLQSYCILMAPDRIKEEIELKNELIEGNYNNLSAAAKRLKAMIQTTDGFMLSETDMKLRGPGDILGIKQSGLPNFNYVNLSEDNEIIELAKKKVIEILKDDPELEKSINELLVKRLKQTEKHDDFLNIA